ncbi:DUF4190 domain-containing protein [Microbacterium koreense]|uniref:DUF4190 domain-containing protein n=1 Tax=Microbacterium koreense TaxID=323761 RepID=A0ABW2ZSX4_9MICO
MTTPENPSPHEPNGQGAAPSSPPHTGVTPPPPAPPYAAYPTPTAPPAGAGNYPPPPSYGGYPQPPQAGYAQQPAGYGYGYPQPRTNVLAVISMIASIVGAVWIIPFFGSLAGAIMGHIALRQVARTGEKGRGMALAGVLVGWIGLGLLVLLILAFVLFALAAASTSGSYT